METEIDAITRIAMNIYSNKGVYVPLLGSGVSLASGIMSGWKVTEDLLKKLAFMQEGSTFPTNHIQSKRRLQGLEGEKHRRRIDKLFEIME